MKIGEERKYSFDVQSPWNKATCKSKSLADIIYRMMELKIGCAKDALDLITMELMPKYLEARGTQIPVLFTGVFIPYLYHPLPYTSRGHASVL